MGKDETGDASQIQTRCENTTTATSCVGRAGGEHLGEQDQNQEEHHSEIGVVQPIEKALIHDVRELPVQQGADRVVTLAIQRREEEDQDAQHHATHQELTPITA